MSDHPPEPTSEQCSSTAFVPWNERPAYACWYPQMGGYAGKAVVVPGVDVDVDEGKAVGRSGCDVFVWHDGEFPFHDASGRSPARLHHCSGEQFIQFGQLIERLCAELNAGTAADAPSAPDGREPPALLDVPRVSLSVDGFGPGLFHEVSIDGGDGGVAVLRRLATSDHGKWLDSPAFHRVLEERFADITRLAVAGADRYACCIKTPAGDFVASGVRLELKVGSDHYVIAAHGTWMQL